MKQRLELTKIYVAMAVALLGSAQAAYAVQTFSTNPGWTSVNTTTSSFNFGYSAATTVAGGAAGEAGGTFTRWYDDEPGHNVDRYHADTALPDFNGATPGDLDLSNTISASGKYDMSAITAGWSDAAGDTTAYVGHFSTNEADKSFIGFQVKDATGAGTYRIRSFYMNSAGGAVVGADTSLTADGNHTFNYSYNPVTDVLTWLLDGNPAGNINVADGAEQFDAFGLLFMFHTTSGTGSPATRTAQLFIDDVDYTGLVEVPEPSTFALAGLGLVGAIAARRRRRS